ncbi:transcriptional regulator SplA domain-containing protein [Alteribacillus sp. YIM 98480]|uniref:transcriptional regulator SplA domain-containing protein n=1 Tax=Alteribacillus sp. YIM 98480 TaxID=2606599 RepID=UPI00131EB52F|nr:transcriptional regulator SplA domain-containing protein [Alteribacillus sp. YIM 98480]
MEQRETFQPGNVVYVMYRNPHAQDVANVQEAAVVENPENPGELCLFLYDTYYPLDEEMAIYHTEAEAEKAYEYYFGSSEGGDIIG